MSRCVLMSSCGDVFLISLCLKLWKEHWYDEIDHMYLNFNNHCKVSDEVVGEFMKNWANEPKLTMIYHSEGKSNGPPQVELLKICNEDLVMLIEDDGFIHTSGIVDSWFKKIEVEGFDIVGSPRYSAGEVGEAMRVKYNLDYSGHGDRGYAWWPNFFVARKSDLLKTDLDFGSKHYPKGIYFKELDHTMTQDEDTDTGTWMNIQLRNLGAKDFSIPQNHAHPDDFEKDENMELWKGNVDYIHGGSLSSGWGGYLQNPPTLNTEMEIKDMETRIAFWMLAVNQTEGFDKFKIEYAQGIQNLADKVSLDKNRISRKFDNYKRIMKL